MSITFEGVDASNKFSRIESYGGRLTENLCQATARDLLAEAMWRMEKAGLDIQVALMADASIRALGKPSEVLNEERRYINQMRIDVVRKLKNMPEIRFVGGLLNNGTSQALAPDLVMPAKMVDRRNYLRLMHKSDICIGTMGLHESIGWKTGEYVAAAKAIVNEKFHYTVPGDFAPEKNYLEFETAEQCIAAVESLIASPEKVYEMKCRNREYYLNYLRPDVLIRNTLDIADRNLYKRI
jgi:hypothetical protein